MIAAHPLTGVGPNMVERVYAQYRDPDAVDKVNPHLHNVPMQIAAERGLPALAIWLWFVVVAAARSRGASSRRAGTSSWPRRARGDRRHARRPASSSTTSGTRSS